MNKLYLSAFFAVLIASAAGAETLFERSFQQMGYGVFAVEGAGETGCTEIPFLFPADINALAEGIYPIASVGVEFWPVRHGTADLNVYLNGDKIAGLVVGDFKCSARGCWERLFLPQEKLLQEENTLRVCMQASDSITKLTLLNNSMVGLYKTADFLRDGAFQMLAEKQEVVIGEKVKITVLLHNKGSASAFAEVRHARKLAEDKNAFFVVEGKTSFKGFVKAGEQIEFSYVIKPRVLGSITPPPAVLYYKNEFGEEEAIFSNLTPVAVREPERKVEAFIVKQVEVGRAGKAIELQLAVKNVGSDPLYDLVVELQLPQELHFVKAAQREINALQPNQTELLPFSVASSSEGRFAIGCTVEYVDLNVTESKCSDSSVEFKEPEISPTLYVGMGLTILAVLIYLYLRFGK
ncbi:hypothetical protein DRN67_04685 [Candidatus Micrarchaeota archaeon]|nr:MAG: hypothetical protein DRN67_04685 [Candidatus Micrarchaeota archaeon]